MAARGRAPLHRGPARGPGLDPAPLPATARRTARLAALREGSFAWLAAPAGVLAWERTRGGDRRVLMVNFTGEPAALKLPGAWRVEVASDGRGEGAAHAGALGPDAALVLAPRAG
jgi:hypothetical protein